MPIRLKRWNERRQKDDGYRLLICRYQPRALPSAKEPWDAWCPDLGPSIKLHSEYHGKKVPHITWDDFRARYLEEMARQSELIDELASLVAEGKTITLLGASSSTDAALCHRTLLGELIMERVAVRGPAAVAAV